MRKLYGQRRIGHAGTLDPDATGVLLVGLGRATRLLRFLQTTDKTYLATICFGVATSTLDAAGEVLDRRPMPLTLDEVATAAQRFVGDIERVDIDDEQARAVRHGMTFPTTAFGDLGEGPFAFVAPGGDLLAVYERRGAGVKPAVVVVGAPGE